MQLGKIQPSLKPPGWSLKRKLAPPPNGIKLEEERELPENCYGCQKRGRRWFWLGMSDECVYVTFIQYDGWFLRCQILLVWPRIWKLKNCKSILIFELIWLIFLNHTTTVVKSPQPFNGKAYGENRGPWLTFWIYICFGENVSL